jgi:hypothetical protein
MGYKYLFQNQNGQEEKKMNKKVLLVILAMTIIAGNAWAADVIWLGGDAGDPNDWFIANNWDTGVPGSGDKAKINLVNPPYGPIIAAGTADVNQLYVAESNGIVPGAQTLKVTGGVLNVNAEAVLGFGRDDVNDVNDDGKLLVTGGTVNCNQHLFVGNNPGAIGRLQIDSGTVGVNQMFGLSWNGGKGYAQLNGGTLTTEQFEFENVAGGTASMNITGGTWIQKHFWWDKIRSLIWNGKITGYGSRANVVVTWEPNAIDPNEDKHVVTALAAPTAPNLIIVKQTGGGDYDEIQDALDDVNGLGLTEFSVIEVRDSATYTENLQFPSDVNYLTLQAGSGFSPTIEVSGTDINTVYIGMNAAGQTIQGFNINFGSGNGPPVTDNNSVMIISYGGTSTVRDCTITGPTVTSWIAGIRAVAKIEDVELSKCRIGVVCDLNEVGAGFRYSITDSHFHDNWWRALVFADCNAVVNNCLVEDNGAGGMGAAGSILTEGDGNDLTNDALYLLITNSMVRGAKADRNICLEADFGTVTIEDSIIMDSVIVDEILMRWGTLNMNRCIVKRKLNGAGACLNLTPSTTPPLGMSAVANIDHCTFRSSDLQDWAMYTIADPNNGIFVKNSIVTGLNGLLQYGSGGVITSNWNNVYVSGDDYGIDAVAGPNDIVPGVDPLFIQTNDASLDTFFAIQPYSPVVNADENGSYMGAKGPMTGYEEFPGDLDGTYGVDFNDFAVLASYWRDSNTIPAVNDVNLENFEGYNTTPELLGDWQEVDVTTTPWQRLSGTHPTYYHDVNCSDTYMGTSTITLLTDPNDVNTGTRAMRWVYDVNAATGGGRNTELVYVLASEIDLETYKGTSTRAPDTVVDRIQVKVKRHAGNSPGSETFMYAKFLNDIYGTYGKGGRDLTGPDYYDVAMIVVGGSTDDPNAATEWDTWTINLDSGSWDIYRNCNTGGYWNFGHVDLEHVGAIIFGIRDQPDGPWGQGQGTIDVDDVVLVDEAGCAGNPVADLAYESVSQDCEVTFEDVWVFTQFWLAGK